MKIEAHNLDAQTLHLLQKTAQYFSANQHQAYLVGGSVRNLLLNEACTDWDIVIDSDAPKLARQLADSLGGYYAHMHDKATRVIVKHDEQETIVDVSPLYENSIESDLHQRDFTINAIAVPLLDVVRHFEASEALPLIDPLNGATDLERRCLRAIDNDVFKHDPLRMLRAVRFMMRYHLTIDAATEHMLIRDASLLPLAASERIHDELYAILGPNGATEQLRFLDEHGLFAVLMPEFIPARGMLQPILHHWDVLEHSLETVAYLEQLAIMLQQAAEEIRYAHQESASHDLVEIHTLLHEAVQQRLFQFTALTAPQMKLAALLHDIGKTVTRSVDEEGNIRFYGHPQAGVPLAQQVLKRLSASAQDRRLVQQVVANHMRPGQLSRDVVTQRAIRRYFVDLGPTGIYVALISLADHLAMHGPEPLTPYWKRHLGAVRFLLTSYIRERERILPSRLVQPEELMRRLNIEPGPLVGQLLEYIAEAQAEGLIHSKDDAIWLAEEKLNAH